MQQRLDEAHAEWRFASAGAGAGGAVPSQVPSGKFLRSRAHRGFFFGGGGSGGGGRGTAAAAQYRVRLDGGLHARRRGAARRRSVGVRGLHGALKRAAHLRRRGTGAHAQRGACARSCSIHSAAGRDIGGCGEAD